MKRWLLWLLVFTLSLMPFLELVYRTITDQLGANPIESLHFSLGDWALRFLCLGLMITPFKKITGFKGVMRFRRMMGLFAFFYASLHFLVYIGLDLEFSMEQFADEVPKSPYILVGLLTYGLLIPLALTSTKAMQKRLGRHWKKLHRLVYLAAVLAVVHYLWLVKLDLTQPLLYGGLVLILLNFRIVNGYYAKKNDVHERHKKTRKY